MEFVALATLVVLLMAGCGGAKQMVTYVPTPTPVAAPTPEVAYDLPCHESDTDEYFAAVGVARGSAYRMDVLQTSALTNAQNSVRQRLQHLYKGVIADYSNDIGLNKGSNMQNKVERAGTQVIDRMVNDTRVVCGPKFTPEDERGETKCFVGIRINVKQLVNAIANEITRDDELRVRFDEAKFREKSMPKSSELTRTKGASRGAREVHLLPNWPA